VSTPTTEFGFSYEYGVDINLGTAETPNWQPIRFPSAIDPQVTAVSQDGATYDDRGAPNQVKLSESWTLGFTVQAHRLSDGSYLPEVEKLRELAGPDAVGSAATGHFRWYDKPAEGDANPDDAFEGRATVQMNRQNTGNDQIAGWSVTLTGQGRRAQIPNPISSAAPVITSALPSGAGAGDIVTIKGSRFDGVAGAAGVKFGSTNAAAYTVVDATTIVATLPAGSAGAANIVVTHPTRGASAAFTYTRA